MRNGYLKKPYSWPAPNILQTIGLSSKTVRISTDALRKMIELLIQIKFFIIVQSGVNWRATGDRDRL